MQRRRFVYAGLILTLLASACVQLDDDMEIGGNNTPQKVRFDITVTRDGKEVSRERYGVMTKSGPDIFDQFATMNPDIPFGLIGIDAESGALVLDNHRIHNDGSNYIGWFGDNHWGKTSRVTLSAYYPYQTNVVYHEENSAYTIPFSTEDTDAGPLISKTMQRAIDELNRVPLEFQHITNDIGFKVCDVTPTEILQGLIHLRKVTVYNVASAGTYVNDMKLMTGYWHRVGYYRNVLLFEGDAPVGVGSENELFIGYDALADRLLDSHRFYAIPDEIRLGKQYVEVLYDIDGFELNGFPYPPVKNVVAKYALYGLIENNVFEPGKQYTFHIGLDLSSVYHEITFAPTVSDWETKIYENNDDF